MMIDGVGNSGDSIESIGSRSEMSPCAELRRVFAAPLSNLDRRKQVKFADCSSGDRQFVRSEAEQLKPATDLRLARAQVSRTPGISRTDTVP
jgi:hypothetical protein